MATQSTVPGAECERAARTVDAAAGLATAAAPRWRHPAVRLCGRRDRLVHLAVPALLDGRQLPAHRRRHLQRRRACGRRSSSGATTPRPGTRWSTRSRSSSSTASSCRSLVMIGVAISSLLVAYGFARFRFPGRELPVRLRDQHDHDSLRGNDDSAVRRVHQRVPLGQRRQPSSGAPTSCSSCPSSCRPSSARPCTSSCCASSFAASPTISTKRRRSTARARCVSCWTVIFPAVRPALAAVIVLQFIGTWNDLLAPLIYLQDPQNWTIEIALLGYFSRYAAAARTGPSSWPWRWSP